MNLVKLLQISTRKYSSSKIITSLDIFDRNVKKIHRNLTAVDPNNADYDYVKEEVGYRVADRIFDIKRTFNQICDLGCQKGYVSKHLTKVSCVIFEIKTNFLSRI
jgi:hypothetical protein